MKKISFAIPVYNEESILANEISQMVSEINAKLPNIDYEIFLVENGSNDRTPAIINELKQKFSVVRSEHLPAADYGQALRKAISESQGEFVAVFNVDFWDVNFVVKALKNLEAESDLVVGSKSMPGAGDSRPFLRRLITRGFNLVLKIFFGFKGTDTHGLKVMVSSKILPIVQECQTDRVIFDTELILRSQRAGLKSTELPVNVQEKRGTRLKMINSIFRTLKDLVVLFYSLNYQLIIKGLLAVAICFFIVGALRGFPDSPSPWFDEGVNLGIAKTFVQDGIYSLRLSSGEYVAERGLMISTNYPVLAPIALAFKILGVSLASAKVVMFFYLCVFLFLVYALVARSAGKMAAVASLLLIVTFLPFYGDGLSGGLGEVPGLVFFFAGLLLLNKQKNLQIFLAGLAFGLAASTKVFYLVILFALLVSEIYFAVIAKRFPFKRWLLLISGIFPPLAVWFRTLLHNGFSYTEVVRTLNYYNNPYQVHNTIFSNLIKFVTEVTPLHFILLVILLFVYYFFRIKERKEDRVNIVVIIFIILNFIWFLKTPGWYRYFFPAHIIALALLPVSCSRLAARFNKRFLRIYASIIIIGTLIILQSVYYVKMRGTVLYYNPEPRLFSQYLTDNLEKNADVYFIDQPEIWFLYNNPNAKQYLHMNPIMAFGTDFFKSKKLPKYLVGINLENNIYIKNNLTVFEKNYSLLDQFGRYKIFLFKK